MATMLKSIRYRSIILRHLLFPVHGLPSDIHTRLNLTLAVQQTTTVWRTRCWHLSQILFHMIVGEHSIRLLEGLWRPPMTIQGPGNVPKLDTPTHCPGVPYLVSTFFHTFPPVWSPQTRSWPQNGHFGPFEPFWGHIAPPCGHSGPRRRPQHIAPGVP